MPLAMQLLELAILQVRSVAQRLLVQTEVQLSRPAQEQHVLINILAEELVPDTQHMSRAVMRTAQHMLAATYCPACPGILKDAARV